MTSHRRAELTGLRDIASSYDGFVFDVWGTVYDGYQVFPDVIEVFRELRGLGKRIAILSNSPQLPSVVARRLEKIGINAEYHDGIVTSGGETHRQLSAAPTIETERFQGPVYLTGPDRCPDTLPVGMGAIATTVEDANWILNVGPNHPPELVKDYEPLLVEARKRNLPMLCANPDKTVLQGDERHICAGALAERYIALGGDVYFVGKPHDAVFERCQEILGIAGSESMLMIGDNLETDIIGANRFGCGSLLVASGVHGLQDNENGGISYDELGILEDALNAHPNYIMDKLRW